jgi:S1-C subfamily serine protease
MSLLIVILVLKTEPLRQLSLASQMVSHRVAPSVVHIHTISQSVIDPRDETIQFFGPHYERQGQGSGVIVDADGYILTNYHVVHRAAEIGVQLSDQRRVPAEVVGFDVLTDLAVIKVEADGLIAAEWGDSAEVEVGSLVWAVGSPFGLQQSVTSGILSAKDRAEKAGTVYQDFLQTDAAVNPGNSGGPLVDDRGRVIGINTAIVGETYQGISFAIPSVVARDVYDRIRRDGRVARGWLGVRMEEVTPERAQALGLPTTHGVLIAEVVEIHGVPSPAKQAGLQAGDVVIRWNDTPIDNPMTLSRAVAATKVGGTATVEIVRDGQHLKRNVVVSERPER